MLGAIIGDMVGSIYEFANTKRMDFPFFSENSTYTDDSIMTVAVAEWLLSDNTHSHETLEEIMVKYANEYPSPMGGYGGGFAQWLFRPERLLDYKTGEPLAKKYTPNNITALEENEIFVFGSNLAGAHGGGAAAAAVRYFGAIWGQGVGMQGQSYAIPTMHGGVEAIRPYVDEFIEYAKQHPELTFLVTRIGCGIAGFKDEQMAPLFKDCLTLENVVLPKSFCDIIK